MWNFHFFPVTFLPVARKKATLTQITRPKYSNRLSTRKTKFRFPIFFLSFVIFYWLRKKCCPYLRMETPVGNKKWPYSSRPGARYRNIQEAGNGPSRAKYLRLQNSKRTSKCKVFSSTVPAWGKNFSKFLVSGKSHSAEKCKRGAFGSFWTSILLQNRKKMNFIFFLFCKRIDVQKLPKGPLLHFSALCDLPETKKIEKKSQSRKKRHKKIFGQGRD